MPLYRTVTYAAGTSGAQSSVNLDPSICPFNATIGVTLTAGTANYKLQWSIADASVSDANANWFDSTDIPAGSSMTRFSFVSAPYSRIRLNITSLSGGNLVLEVTQGFSKN